VAYSPLARGLLADVNLKELHPSDWRHQVPAPSPPLQPPPPTPPPQLPRHSHDNMLANTALIARVAAIARAKSCTCAQLSLAWLLAQGDDVFPLVGTKTEARLRENAGAAAVELTREEVEELSALPRLQGLRYPEDVHALS